eukprot:SAG25_NODE_4216_length_862_cov_1.331586_1_plen_49_part_10
MAAIRQAPSTAQAAPCAASVGGAARRRLYRPFAVCWLCLPAALVVADSQ